MILRKRRNRGRQSGISEIEQRSGLGVSAIGDDHLARVEVHGIHVVMLKEIRHDEARKALAEARDGIDGAWCQFAKYRQALD